MKILALIPIFILILAVNVSAFTYQTTYYDDSVSGTSIQTDPVSLFSPSASTIHLRQTLLFKINTTSTANYTANWLSPYGVVIGTYSGTLPYNSSCQYLGQATTTISSTEMEGRNTLVHDAKSNPITTKNVYTVTSSNRYINISTVNEDSENYGNNIYYVTGVYAGSIPSSSDIMTNLNAGNYGDCKTLSVDRTTYPETSTVAGNQREFFYMLFNSTAGNVTVHVYTGDFSLGVRATLYRFSDSSAVDTITSAGVLTWDETFTLNPNTMYVIGVGGEHGSVTSMDNPYIHAIVDAGIPDYSDCTDWSECVNGYESRTCNDVNGYQPQSIEQRTCEPTVLENATLGFEAFVRDADIWKCSPSWDIFDPYYLNHTYRDSPLNWSIGENSFAKRDFLKMTTEWATEGSRSLKMWYIPPKNWEVMLNGTGYPYDCGNVTGGTVPYVYQNISNDTFSVSFDVTFPAENMLLRYNVKGCTEQVRQHSDVFMYYPFTDIPSAKIFNELCYANSCSGTPNSRYAINLIDTTTGLSVFGYAKFREASINRSDEDIIDLSNLGLIAGRVYTLVLTIYPENLDDSTGNCVYFDNIRYERIAEPFVTTFLGGSCETQCIGDDLYEATLLQNGECSVRMIEYACLGDDINEALNNGESVCDGNTLLRINPLTKEPEEINCPNGCEDGACITEEQAADEEVTFDETMVALSSIPFVLSLIIMLLCITAGILAKAGEVILFGIGEFIFVCSAVGLLSIFFAVGEIILAISIIAYYISKPARGG